MSQVQDAVTEIQSVLTRRLKLQTPGFRLEPVGGKVSGSIISPSFRGINDSERQRRIWDALNEEYGAESVQRAGSFLAFTPDEWDLDADGNEESAGG